jgi:hypothetical protein
MERRVIPTPGPSYPHSDGERKKGGHPGRPPFENPETYCALCNSMLPFTVSSASS